MLRSITLAWCVAILLTACAETPINQAPIEERSQGGRAPQAAPPPVARPTPTPLPLTREAHDGQDVVQAGDTLYSIALAFGQDYRDIARWSGVDPQSNLQIGQTLRVAPPAGESAAAVASPVAISQSSKVETRPLAPSESIVAQPAAEAPAAAGQAPVPGSPAAPEAAGQSNSRSSAGEPEAALEAPGRGAPVVPATTDNKAATTEPDKVWVWPTAGKVLERFEETHNKGIDIAGSVGDPVWAANDGQVVYSGSGLRGYGKLVIIKHTDDYVSAYAHNNEILVTQGQAVKRGQRIADLGMTDASSPRLHFEIRRKGTPVDPLAYLPLR
jgi:lipoprotein NlpD